MVASISPIWVPQSKRVPRKRNASTRSAVTEIPMSWVYGVGYVASIAMGLMLIGKLVRLAAGKISDDELIQVHDSEDDATPHMQHNMGASGNSGAVK